MGKLKKVMIVIQRWFIIKLNYINAKKFMKVYCKYLKKIGVKFTGKAMPNYIDPSAHFDGIDYSMISIGSNCVISREVLFLIHDYSIFRALKYIGKESYGRCILKPIVVGNNVFIGARSILLPGTVLEDNVIVGAGTVVKGTIPAGSVVVGNPARVIKKTEEYALRWLEKNYMDQ